MAVSSRLRFEILRRENFTCRYCGLRAPEAELRVDHVIPVTLGGRDDPGNLVASCEPCNSGKSSIAPDSPLVDDVAQVALRWRAAIVEARWQLSGDAGMVEDLRICVGAQWAEWMDRDYRVKPMPADWVLSIEPWYRAGLTGHDVPKLMEPAMLRRVDDRWSYFCGTVWRHLDQVRSKALEVVETDPSTWFTQSV